MFRWKTISKNGNFDGRYHMKVVSACEYLSTAFVLRPLVGLVFVSSPCVFCETLVSRHPCRLQLVSI